MSGGLQIPLQRTVFLQPHTAGSLLLMVVVVVFVTSASTGLVGQ